MPICTNPDGSLMTNEAGQLMFGETAEDCCNCCGPRPCCTFDPARLLYLTIDEFDVTGFAGFALSGKASFGAASVSHLVTWATFVCADDAPARVAYTLECEDGLHYLNMFSGGFSAVIDNCVDNNVLFYVALDAIGNVLIGDGIASCDPFFIQGTLPIKVYDTDGVTVLGTGTARYTITE